MDRRRDRYPHSIVWGPLPVIRSERRATLPTRTAQLRMRPLHLHISPPPPYCPLCNAPLPPLPFSWLIPIIGHLGLCDSEGRVHDFAGPYTIGVSLRPAPSHRIHPPSPASSIQTRTLAATAPSADARPLPPFSTAQVDHFMVPVARILPIDLSTLPSSTPSSSTPDDPALLWDDGLHYADGHFSEQMHNICCNNCHHHVAMAMTKMGLGATFGTQVQCAWQVWTRGQWKSRGSMITTLLPFLIIVAVIALAVGLTR